MAGEEERQTAEPRKKKARVQYHLNYPVPEVRSNLEKDIKVMRAFVIASEFGKNHVGRVDVAPFTEINEQIVGGVLSFFSKIGMAEKQGQKYKPCDELISFEQELKYETQDVAGRTLMSLILCSWFGEMASADPDYHKGAINHLIGYLQLSGVIMLNEDSMLYTINTGNIDSVIHGNSAPTLSNDLQKVEVEVTREIPIANNNSESPVEETTSDKRILGKSIRPNITLNLNIQIDSSSDTNKIKEILNILKGVLEER